MTSNGHKGLTKYQYNDLKGKTIPLLHQVNQAEYLTAPSSSLHAQVVHEAAPALSNKGYPKWSNSQVKHFIWWTLMQETVSIIKLFVDFSFAKTCLVAFIISLAFRSYTNMKLQTKFTSYNK